MTILKTLTLTAALIAGTASLTMAQNAPVAGGENGNSSGMPPKSYQGPGAMQSYSSSKFQAHRALYNQASGGANSDNGMPPKGYQGPGAMQSYSPSEFQGNR
jgi:hypothetical protein